VKDQYVSVEIPGLMAEAGIEGLRAALERTARKGRHKQTRQAAKNVLENLAQ
jgi:hypothetical protein